MSLPTTFYVKNNAGQTVLAKYLQVNGAYVSDPNTAKSLNTPVYLDSSGVQQFQNANGYLIVPADYNITSSISLGKTIAAVDTVSPVAAYGTMWRDNR